MTDHVATTAPATCTYRVYFRDELVLTSDAAIEVHERFGDRSFPPVPYFPPSAVDALGLTATEHTTHCPVKGDASYWSFQGEDNVAWTYANPFDGVASIAGYVGFDQSKGFRVDAE